MDSMLESLGIDVVRDYSRAIGEAYNEWKASLGSINNSKYVCKRGSEICKLLVLAVHDHEKLITPVIDKSAIPKMQARHDLPAKPEVDNIKLLSLENSHMHLSSIAQEVSQSTIRYAERLETRLEAALQYQPKEETRVSALQALDLKALEKQILWRAKMHEEMRKEREEI
mmetsp:Transcript_30153/g.53429  ORF Transcript_30153/g.53429 Transcript_30153/m.53429 type:complete len:170 (-) Transcript_30153:292-801(-)